MPHTTVLPCASAHPVEFRVNVYNTYVRPRSLTVRKVSSLELLHAANRMPFVYGSLYSDRANLKVTVRDVGRG